MCVSPTRSVQARCNCLSSSPHWRAITLLFVPRQFDKFAHASPPFRSRPPLVGSNRTAAFRLCAFFLATVPLGPVCYTQNSISPNRYGRSHCSVTESKCDGAEMGIFFPVYGSSNFRWPFSGPAEVSAIIFINVYCFDEREANASVCVTVVRKQLFFVLFSVCGACVCVCVIFGWLSMSSFARATPFFFFCWPVPSTIFEHVDGVFEFRVLMVGDVRCDASVA